MKKEGSVVGVQTGGGAIEYKVQPGQVKGGCTSEINPFCVGHLGIEVSL